MGGGKGSNTTSSTFTPPKEFMDAYKEALGMARTATGQPYQQYQGPLVAGLSQTQQQGVANVNAAQGMALPAIQRGMQYTNEAARGITPELYQKFYSPYVQDVAQSTFANLMESQAQQQSGLKGSAIQAGAFGGDRSGVASAEMARQQQLANAMAMSNIYNQGYGQAMGLAGQQVANLGSMGQQLAGLGAGAQGSVLQGAQAQMAAGAQEQATEQARLQAAYDQWMQRQAYPFQQAQFFANVAQGLGAGAGGSSSTTAPAPSLGSQILGGLGAVGSIYSDKRMKENIQAVGKLNDGQTVYRYNFKGDPKTQIGLLAQEVEESKPGAVTQVRGLKMVDYKGATEDAAEMSSMGGVVSPSADRQGLAGGGIPYYPYGGALGYIPEGKINVRSNSIPDAPKPYEDEGLGKEWQSLMPLSKEQIGGLRKMASDVGIDLPGIKPTSAETEESEEKDDYGLGLRGLFQKGISYLHSANGGVVGRRGYEDGGIPEDEEQGLASVPEPESDVVESGLGVAPVSPPESENSEGVAAAEAAPGSYVIPGEDQPSGLGKIFDIRKAFASEENPSIIERVMGRRLSPEARSAVLNASFALMAGRSPFFFTNLGEAGRVGTQTYYNALQNQRELAKQEADISLAQQERDIRQTEASTRIASLILPIVRKYLATGQPVPPQYLRMLDKAYPPGSPERADLDQKIGGTDSTITSTPIVTGGAEQPPVSLPESGGAPLTSEQGVVTNAPPPATESASGDLRSIYESVPSYENPYYWDQRAKQAEAALETDLAQDYREQANAIRQRDFDRGYINVPGQGAIPYPNKMEMQTQQDIRKSQTESALKATSEQTESADSNIANYQTAKNTLDQAAANLVTTQTGQLEDTKAYLVTVLNSLGLSSDAEALNQAVGVQKTNKTFSQILFAGGLKDKIGAPIAATELQMYSRGFGDVSLEPAANRFIVGTMRGILDYENKRSLDWIDEINKRNGAPMSRREIAAWRNQWSKDNPISDFVDRAIADTPVKGELNFSDPSSRSKAKPGYKYVLPDGRIGTYNGSGFDLEG